MKVNQLSKELNERNFSDYPPIAIEWRVTKGRDDISLGKLQKRINILIPTFNEIWPLQLNFINSMRFFPYLERTVFNQVGIMTTILEFAALQKSHETLVKAVKKKARDEAREYYKQFDDVLSINVFDIMMDDALYLTEKARERGMGAESFSREEIAEHYKASLKSLKK